MSRRVVGVTLDNLEQLPLSCRRCVYWEVAPHLKEQAEQFGETEVEKGSLGVVGAAGGARVADSSTAVTCWWDSCSTRPRTPCRGRGVPHFAASPMLMLLTAFYVLPEFRRWVQASLVQAAVADLTKRGVRAIEAFGDAQPETEDDEHICVVPAAFLRSVGSRRVRPHPRWPRLRLELRSDLLEGRRGGRAGEAAGAGHVTTAETIVQA